MDMTDEVGTRLMPRATAAPAPRQVAKRTPSTPELAVQHHEAHRWEEAATAYHEAIRESEDRAATQDWKVTARLHNNLAMVLRELDRSAEAEDHYVKALVAYDAAPQHEVADEICALLGNLAFLHFDCGQYSDALKVQDRALAVCEMHRAEDLFTLGENKRRAGIFAYFADQSATAQRHFERALELIEQTGCEQTSAVIELLINLAATHLKTEDYANALLVSGHAARKLDESASSDDLLLAAVLNNIGCLQLRLGRPDEARDALNWGLRLLKAHPVSDDTARAETYHNLALAHEALGNQTSAQVYRRFAKELFISIGDDCRTKIELAEAAQQSVVSSAAKPSNPVTQTFVRQPVRVSHTMAPGALSLPMKTETIEWEF
jgi:tetratricopeptide (TPR) repeat protein